MASAIVPFKIHSRRLPYKNIRVLGDKFLCSYIFETLLRCKKIDDIYVYSSNLEIINLLPEGVKLLPRPEYLNGDAIKANELFRYAVERIEDEIIVLSQIPGPFITSRSIELGINKIESGEFRSALSVKRLQTYCWFNTQPLNYDPQDMAQTQDLKPVYAETSGFYIFKKEDYLKTNSRINMPAYPVEVSDLEGIDIDTEEDYMSALRTAQQQIMPGMPDLSSASFIQNIVNGGPSSDRQVHTHIAFDLDGVLIDSLELMKESWTIAQKVDEVVINQPFEVYAKHIGKPFVSILEDIGIPKSHHEEVRFRYEEYSRLNSHKIHLYEGVIDLLKKCQDSGVKCSIVTSKSRTRTLDILERFLSEIDFASIITPESVKEGRGKPYADQLLKSCLESESNPSNTLYVGDMEVDYFCAKNSSVEFAHALWGYGSHQKYQRHLSFLSPKDLADYFFKRVEYDKSIQ